MVMVLFEHIHQKRKLLFDNVDDRVKKIALDVANDLIIWCRRESVVPNDAPYETINVKRIIRDNDRFIEISMPVITLMIQRENSDLLSLMDKRFLKGLKSLKMSRINDGHIWIYGHLFDHLLSKEEESYYVKNYDRWLLFRLLFDRIDETTRLVERYKTIKRFGPVVVYHKDFSIEFDYSGKVLLNELIKREVFKYPRKGFENGTNKDNYNRGKM